MKVTVNLAVKAVLMGACRIPEVGKRVKDFSFSDLVWGERLFTGRERKKFKVPLWCYGTGYG